MYVHLKEIIQPVTDLHQRGASVKQGEWLASLLIELGSATLVLGIGVVGGTPLLKKEDYESMWINSNTAVNQTWWLKMLFHIIKRTF